MSNIFCFSLLSSELNRIQNSTMPVSFKNSEAKIVVKTGSDCPFLVANGICIDSSLHWTIYMRGNLNIHYPDKESMNTDCLST